ncbi:MAG TPA: hypothetical protein DCS67_03065, partial [Clostridiales bacterium UBA8960]|nr:hypothetical protein [Clostridiales bacterium UBA8960]
MYRKQLLEKIALLDNNPKAYIHNLLLQVDFEAPVADIQHAHDLLLLGRGYLLTGKHDMALIMLNKALSYLTQHGDKMSLFQCYSNLGIVYREERQYDLALKALNKCYNIAYDLDDFSYIILALVNIASIYSSLENVSKAYEIFEKALEYKDRLKNTKILGDLYNNFAFVLMGELKYQDALNYFFKGYEEYKSVYGDTIQTNIVIVLSNIGESYVLLGDYDNAEVYISKALKAAEDMQIKFIEIDCHLNLSKMFEAQGDYKLALEHHKRYTELNEEVAKEEIQEEIDDLRNRMLEESKKSEAEINLLRNVELKNKTNELEKTLKNLAQISQIGQKLTSSMDIDQIYEILRSSIYALMKVDVFGLALYEQSEQMIVYKYFEEGGKPLPLMEIHVEDRVSLASYCIVHDEDLFIKSFEEEYQMYLPNLNYVAIGNDDEKSTLCIIYCRLIIDGLCIGLITMQSYEPYEYGDSDFEVIKALASYVAIAISNAQKKNIISEKAKELEYLSYNDPLTNLYKSRYFNRLAEWYNNEERALPLGLIIGDMNDLKEINDTYGHMLGDQYLSEVARIIKNNAGFNPVFRLGG